ncbi:MAG: RIO1 family regulatory kinase/ATPase [Candidatus Micrarchaeota archaeon]
MASKLSTRKRPDRDVKMLTERQHKFSERAFDDPTIRTLKFLISNRVFSSLDFPIQHGKEAAVYRATREAGEGKEYLAVKIFKYEGPSFQKRVQYMEGDKRFDVPKNKRALVRTFARKEYANLKILEEGGVHVPKPVKQRDNIVVMEFLGEGGMPSALLKDVVLEDAEKTLSAILSDMKKMNRARIVHVDLSEYNVIIHKGEPFIIDVGQAVLTHHPQAEEFLQKDLMHILKYFGKEGVEIDKEKASKYIKGESSTYR